MIRAFILLFMVNTAHAGCLEALSTKDLSAPRLAELTRMLKDAGAKDLVAPLENGSIKIEHSFWRLPWQSEFSGRQGWFQKPKLKVRELRFKNEKEKQEDAWRLAMTLFELQTRSNLFSVRAMLPPDDQRTFDLSMQGSDESLEYFLGQMPGEWRDNHIRLVEKLETEMYAVFTKLDQLEADKLLPAQDPGRFWKLRSIYGGDAARAIAPNQEDLKDFREGKFAGNVAKRHGRNVIFNYYMNFMKRAIMISMAVQVAMFVPELRSLPSYIEALYSVSEIARDLDGSSEKSREMQKRYQENLKKQVQREEQRLKTAIAKSTGAERAAYEKELADLYESYPWLAHAAR